MHMMERMPWVETRPSYSPLAVPAPLAFFGVLVAYMLGLLMGAMMGKKSALVTMNAGHKAAKMSHHHHHGWGEDPCAKRHGHHGWGEMMAGGGAEQQRQAPRENQAAPGAQPGEHRNEGE